MRVGSLFTGCGGLDLGLPGHTVCVWMCESDRHARRVLERRFPGVPVYPDVRELDGTAPAVDMLVGGFPCTDLSVAGKRAGIEGDQSGLWVEFARVIRELRPGYVMVENVSALLTGGDYLCVPCGIYGQVKSVESATGKRVPLAGSWCSCCDVRLDTRAWGTLFRSWMGVVLGDLAEAGFDAQWLVVRASDVGAPHRRERLFCLATDAEDDGRYGARRARRRRPRPENSGASPSDTDECDVRARRGRRGTTSGDPAWSDTQTTADADGDGLAGERRQQPERHDLDRRGSEDVAWGAYEPAIRRWEHALGRPAPRPTDDRGRLMPAFVEWMQGLPEGWVDVDGVSRTQQLRMLGNACVPQQVALAWRILGGGA